MHDFSVDQAFMKAKHYAKKGEIVEAQKIYKSILQTYSKNKRAQQELDALKNYKQYNTIQNPSQEVIGQLMNLYNNGQFSAVIEQSQFVINKYPDAFKIWTILGASQSRLGMLNKAIESFIKSISIKSDNVDAYINMANAYLAHSSFDKAIEAYKKSISLKADYVDAYINMGVALQYQGKLDKAIIAYKKAIFFKPDYAEAYNNMGNALKDQGMLNEAIESFNKSISLKPYYADAYNNMGNALIAQGKLDEAIEVCNKSISFRPDYTEAYCNVGNALQAQGKLDEAINKYQKAISLKTNYTEAYCNMGVALKAQGKFEDAIRVYKKVLLLDPGYTDAYFNMGNALNEQGKLEEAIESFNKLLAINPEHSKAWNNIFFPLQAIKIQITSENKLASFNPEISNYKYAQIEYSILNYRLKLGGESAEDAMNKTLSLFASFESLTIKNPTFNSFLDRPVPTLPKKIISLVHFGRSGTGLLHSLVDGHPKVSTLPSIYFSEYFDQSTWEQIISGGWNEMVNRFMAIYAVLFDANSNVPIKSKGKQLLHNVGQSDGMANVGKRQDGVLTMDKTLFQSEMNRLMNSYSELDALVFFKLVHTASDKVINDVKQNNLIFYHIHNPDSYAQLNFLRSVPNANWVMMVREPLQSCESWIRTSFKKNDYFDTVNKIVQLLFEIDNVIYHKQKTIGVRLEDLKKNPRKTIPALCNWMGIEEKDNLYEMTAQGKKWWGDPSSLDYEKEGMKPFGTMAINRKVGSILSKNDQFILYTLFYPFIVRFGYVEENLSQFKVNLERIKPMLNQMFDFEQTIVSRTKVDTEQFIKSGPYLYFRSKLIDRWNTLKKFGTYPNMIMPLEINKLD